MLTSFGTFWGAEGAGVRWPGKDAALLAVIAMFAATALCLVRWLQRLGADRDRAAVRAL
jgi:uncharacterized membrane protein